MASSRVMGAPGGMVRCHDVAEAADTASVDLGHREIRGDLKMGGGLFSLGLAKKFGRARRRGGGDIKKGAMPGTAAGAARNPWLVFLRERARSEAYRADTSTAATAKASAGSSGTSMKDVGSMAMQPHGDQVVVRRGLACGPADPVAHAAVVAVLRGLVAVPVRREEARALRDMGQVLKAQAHAQSGRTRAPPARCTSASACRGAPPGASACRG
jgi:hypothetical protein